MADIVTPAERRVSNSIACYTSRSADICRDRWLVALCANFVAKVAAKKLYNRNSSNRTAGASCIKVAHQRLAETRETKTGPMNDRFLKTGVFLAPFHALDENPLLALDRDMELLVHLDRLNYHEAWVGEHHSGGFEIIACPELFIAAAAERTRHIRLGTGVVSLPYHNPFTVAGRLMQLDYMTRGRAMFGVGPGSLVYDAVKMGLKPEDQRRKLDESLDVIMELMQGRVVTKKTDWFDLQEARLQLKSYSQPMMEMAVASNAISDRRIGGRQAWHRHALDRRHVG